MMAMSSKRSRIRASDALLRNIRAKTAGQAPPMSSLAAAIWLDAIGGPLAVEAACAAIGLDSGYRLEVAEALRKAGETLRWLEENRDRIAAAFEMMWCEELHPNAAAAQALALTMRLQG